ncbi:MAG: carboxypeptidase-like regulatory domain-containing protein, partial [Planctomycetota bacterium]
MQVRWTVTRQGDSNPVAGATIVARPVAGRTPEAEATTDAAGAASFDAPIGEYVFAVRAPGFKYLELRRVLAEGRDETIPVTLTEGVTLDGQVLDAAGQPVEGAEVIAQRV